MSSSQSVMPTETAVDHLGGVGVLSRSVLRFMHAVTISEAYHDVQSVVRTLVLRQAMSADEGRGVRFEIEPAIYFLGTEWTTREAILRFSIPQAALAASTLGWSRHSRLWECKRERSPKRESVDARLGQRSRLTTLHA